MGRNIMRMVIVYFTLALSLGAVPAGASAQGAQGPAHDGDTCSTAGAAGTWGSMLTGTLYRPTGAAAFAVVTRASADADGNLSGTQTTSVGGSVSQEAPKGTWNVNPDCTGTLTVSIYDQAGHVLRTAVWATVFNASQTEYRAIIQSLTLANGTKVPAVVTLIGKKLFPGRGSEGTCSTAGVAGPWGYTETGTIYPPSGPVLSASVVSYALDAAGNLSGARTNSTGGTTQKGTIKGTAIVNPDCTGTETYKIYDESGNVIATVVKALVYVDNAREAFKIITSGVLPNGASLPTVLTTDATKLSAGAAGTSQGAAGTSPGATGELTGTASGTMAGSSGGSFAYYQISKPTGATLTLSFNYGPFDAIQAHAIGLNVYQNGSKLGSVTGQSGDEGDAASTSAVSLALTPSASGGPVLIQVFNYSDHTASYTLAAQ